jgi:hypothetical protein
MKNGRAIRSYFLLEGKEKVYQRVLKLKSAEPSQEYSGRESLFEELRKLRKDLGRIYYKSYEDVLKLPVMYGYFES